MFFRGCVRIGCVLEAPGNLSAAVLARRMECAVCCVTYILQFLRPRFLKPLTLIANRPLKNVGQVPLGSIIIRHNGVQGLAGHFNGTKAITSNGINAPTFDLGRAVIPARKQRNGINDPVWLRGYKSSIELSVLRNYYCFVILQWTLVAVNKVLNCKSANRIKAKWR